MSPWASVPLLGGRGGVRGAEVQQLPEVDALRVAKARVVRVECTANSRCSEHDDDG